MLAGYWLGQRIEALEAAAPAQVQDAEHPLSDAAPKAAPTATTATEVDAVAAGAATPKAADQDGAVAGAYVFHMESCRHVPRQPCLPDVRSAFSFHAAPSSRVRDSA